MEHFFIVHPISFSLLSLCCILLSFILCHDVILNEMFCLTDSGINMEGTGGDSLSDSQGQFKSSATQGQSTNGQGQGQTDPANGDKVLSEAEKVGFFSLLIVVVGGGSGFLGVVAGG